MQIINMVKSVDILSWVILFTLVMVVIGLYIKRTSPYVKEIVKSAVIDAERHFNSGQGQLKLKFATEKIRQSLPLVLRVFITHRMIVTMIEITLNKISHTFELDTVVDIIGNEDMVHKKINIQNTDEVSEIEISLNQRKPEIVEESKAEVYASLRAKTDWRDNTETSVEVGFKKKL